MPLILVVEQDDGVVARLRQTLGAEGGWRVQHVRSGEEAMQRVASEAPDLFVVSTRIRGASQLLGTFARRQGGPGTLALVPDGTAETDPAAAGYGADAVLAPPISGERVRQAIEGILHGGDQAAPAPSAPSKPARDEPKLTSHDIFGDLVAEVEQEAENRAARSRDQPPAGPAESPPAAAPQPPRRIERTRVDDDIERRLEQTLSGVLPGAKSRSEPRPETGSESHAKSKPGKGSPPEPSASQPAGQAPPPRKSTRQSDVDALISKTLSGLESPPAKRPARPADRSPDLSSILGEQASPKRAPTAPKPTGPKAPSDTSRPAETPGFDLSDLEELARTSSWRRTKTTEEKPPAEAASTPPEATERAGTPPAEAARPAEPARPAQPAGAPPAAEAPDTPAPAAPAPPPFTPKFADTIEEVPEGAGGALPPEEEEEAAAVPAAAAAQAGGEPSDHPTDQGVAFGQYRLQERIGVGGMAEVWKARMTGVEGFQKIVAIKKILPHLTDSSDFVDMFVDEAKLAAQLNHAHIIHIYDLGRIEGDYYIAMEYVEGENLRAILNAARERGRPLPVGLALHVAARLASALDYAHRKRDFEDRSLELVHRDVSPQNVLIGYEGTIKLCDFGIVKAVSKTSHTRMGALKGKLQYMSPEQAWGRNVDGRSDIFSLGALLFEMLTGRRLFSGDSEMEVLEAVRECRIQAPGSLDPSVPEEVDEIVLKALAREPDERFQTAGNLERQIEEVLVAMRPAPGQSELATYMRDLFERGDKPAPAAGDGSSVSGLSGLPDLTDLTDDTGTPPAAAAPPEARRESLPATDGPSPPPAAGGQPAAPEAPALRPDATGTGAAKPAAAAAPGKDDGTATGVAAAASAQEAPKETTGAGAVVEAASPVEAVEPVAEVEPEEGGGKGKGLLIAAIAAALLLAALLFWFVWLPRMRGDGTETPDQAPNAEQSTTAETPKIQGEQPPVETPDAAGTPLPEGAAPPADGTGEAGAAPSGEPARPSTDAAAPGTTKEGEQAAVSPEVEERLDEALARREEELRKEFEAKQKELAARVEAANARAAEPVPEPAAGDSKPQAPPPRKTRESPPPESAGPSGSTEPAGSSDSTGSRDAEATVISAAGGSGESAGVAAKPASATGGAASPAAAGGDHPETAAASEREPTANRQQETRTERPRDPEPAAPPKPSVRVGQLVQMGPGVVPPQLVTFEKPEYPPIARRLRIQGEVVVGLLVDENGNVADVRLERSVPQKVGINEAALKAARQAKYRPATKDGVRVKMWTTLKIPFRL